MENKRHIPDFFLLDDNSPIIWERRKAEIKELFQNEIYGHFPKKLTPSIKTEEREINFASKARWESVYFTFENDKGTHTVKTDLILPRGKTSIPVFLSIGFSADVPNKYLPIEEIIDNGFGVFHFCYENVTKDNNDFSDGLASLFEGDFGKITLWAYMASQCMDYLCTRDEVDTTRVAIIGHSRLGKTALVASAFDERFFLTCSNDSGCLGASVSRGKVAENETIEAITDVFPFWFSKKFLKYRDNVNSLPLDQHMLLALIAPRHLIIGTAKDDLWADNEGQLLSCTLASRAWELYGKAGLINDMCEPCAPFELTKGTVSFYEREGSHFQSRTDWIAYMKKFKEILNEA